MGTSYANRLPCVVEVMALGGWEEGQVVSTVIDSGTDNHQGIPEPGHSQMGPGYDWAKHHWEKVDHKVLQRVTVDRGNSNWSCPLVVGLVNVFVETGVVE